MKNPYEKIKTQPITALVLLILTVSFFWHASYRTEHFQECDSATVQDLLIDYSDGVFLFLNPFNQPGKIFNQQSAEKALSLPFVKSLAAKLGSPFEDNKTTNWLVNYNPVFAYKKTLFDFFDSLKLPYPFRSAYAISIGSNYSAGAGFLYGLATSPNLSYETFISHSTLLTLLLFHLSVLWLFFAALKLKIKPIAAALMALLMLFSISLYSSGFHLGSTVWNIATGSFWLFLMAKYLELSAKDRLKKMSLWMALLIWFNYLIILYWLAWLIVEFINLKKLEGLKKSIKIILLSQWPAILSAVINLALFFMPGQGKRGNIQLTSFGSDVYHLILNFFAIFNSPAWLNHLQFILALGLVLTFIYLIFKKKSGTAYELLQFKNFTQAFIGVYIFFRLINFLGFAPNRHVLFIAPVLFLGIAWALDSIIKQTTKRRFSIFVLILISTIGFSGINQRQALTKDLTKNLFIEPDISEIVIGGCSHTLKNMTYAKKIPANFENPNELKTGITYLYASQTTPFEGALLGWQAKYSIKYTILSHSQKITDAYFLAFNPGAPNRFPWTRPNNLFLNKFIIHKIEPLP